MARPLRSLYEAWLALGFGCLLGAAVIGGFDAWQLADLDEAPIQRSTGFAAVLQRDGKGYVLQTASGSRIPCMRDQCGYPSAGADLGLSRTFYMAGGRLIGVERESELIDLRYEIKAMHRSKVWIAVTSAVLALPCFWAAWRARKYRLTQQLGAPA
jgi:hypothetical protein